MQVYSYNSSHLQCVDRRPTFHLVAPHALHNCPHFPWLSLWRCPWECVCLETVRCQCIHTYMVVVGDMHLTWLCLKKLIKLPETRLHFIHVWDWWCEMTSLLAIWWVFHSCFLTLFLPVSRLYRGVPVHENPPIQHEDTSHQVSHTPSSPS